MPTPSTSKLPVPKSWDEFEVIAVEIHIKGRETPNVTRCGRQGQAQQGVVWDIRRVRSMRR